MSDNILESVNCVSYTHFYRPVLYFKNRDVILVKSNNTRKKIMFNHYNGCQRLTYSKHASGL